MRVGLALPVVSAGDDVWERFGDLDDISLVAEAADRLGYHHLAWPVPAAPGMTEVLWDPTVTLAYLAARTERIRLVAPVLPPAASPDSAARHATLQRTLDGRLITSVSRGQAPERFLDNPTWVVGRSPQSARHALTTAEGWQSLGMPSEATVEVFRGVVWPDSFEMIVCCGRLDPIGEPAAALHALRAGWAVGASLSTVALSSVSADHFCEQMNALRDLLVEDGEV